MLQVRHRRIRLLCLLCSSKGCSSTRRLCRGPNLGTPEGGVSSINACSPFGARHSTRASSNEAIMAIIARDGLLTLETDKGASKSRCPTCCSIDVRRSTRHGWGDIIRRFRGMFPWRCGICGTRFYLPKRSERPPAVNDCTLTIPCKIIDTSPEE